VIRPRWRLRLLPLAVALVLVSCARTPVRPAAPPGPTREVLANGVVMIAQEHRAADVVSLQLWVRVGGRDETSSELGLSHYLEHMLFKGTPTRPPGSIDRLIEGFGGSSNAFTSYDFTHFDLLVPSAHVRPAMALLADIAVNASFVPAELEAEKKVVLEEMAVLGDDPDRFLVRRLSETAYPGHPYGRPILGTRQIVEHLTREQLNAYYKKHYVPQNMVLVVVGPVPVVRIRALASETFGRLSGPAALARPVTPIPSLAGGRRDDVPRPERQAGLGMAWQAPGTRIAADDITAVDLLTYILGDGPSSRLNQTVREDERLVQSIEARYVTRERSGIVSITARLEAEKMDAAQAAILDVIRRVRADGVTEAERQRALVTAEAAYAFDIETAEGLARSYGQAETTWTLGDELQYLARLRQVTVAEIQAAARTYFGDDDYARVRLRPAGAR
jgi:predicted Zn-dependent peptidase